MPRDIVNNEDIFTNIRENSHVKTVRTNVPDPREDSIAFFTLIGYNDSVDAEDFPTIEDGESDKVCAKRVIRNRIARHYIRMNQFGELIYPLDRTFMKHSKKIRNGQEVWKFREVSSSAFRSYLMFLKTQNPKHYHLAKRTS